MNQRSKDRVRKLIESEYADRLNLCHYRPNERETEAELNLILKSEKSLSQMLRNAKKIQESLAKAERDFHTAIQEFCKREYGTEIHIHENQCCEDALQDLAFQAAKEKASRGYKREGVIAEKRKLLAMIEMAKTEDDLKKILQSAGVL